MPFISSATSTPNARNALIMEASMMLRPLSMRIKAIWRLMANGSSK
ncbi:MAG: hypothetical protein IJ635_10690 [Bacteroidaceae bacterium]|nr:hypothetical protein [Bacteroidaceae bacterium]